MKTIAMLFAAAMTLAAQSPLVEGNTSSAVRVIIYEDLQCPDCANFRQMMDKDLLPKYKTTVAFEHRDFPLPKHNWARRASVAAKYFQTLSPDVAIEFRRSTMAKQEQITDATFNEYLGNFAKTHKVDPAKAIAALDDPALIAEVEKGYREGIARGIAHTPTVLVNGEPFIEEFPVADVIKTIDRELAASKH
jgi:protein-disulfide isomerase